MLLSPIQQKGDRKLVNTYCQKLQHHYIKKENSSFFPPSNLFCTCLRDRKGLDSHLLEQSSEIITLALVYVAKPDAIYGQPYCCAVLLCLYVWNGQYIEEGQNHSPEAEIKSVFLRSFHKILVNFEPVPQMLHNSSRTENYIIETLQVKGKCDAFPHQRILN